MRPRNRLFLFALIIFLLFGTVPAVKAQTDCTPVTAGTSIDSAQLVSCDIAPICYSSEITDPAKVYYYSIDGLVAGQVLTIDVDTDGLSSSLDSVLEFFDSDGNLLDISYDDPAPGEKESIVDPYMEFTVPADGGGTYKFGISADGAGATTGPYTFVLECSDQPTTSEFKWPDEVGALIGSTGSDTGSLINISPADAQSSLPLDLGVGRIADIEFDPSTNKLFVAISESPGSIITFDPATGDQDQTFSLVPVTETVPTVVALEAVEDKLYGIQVDDTSGEQFSLVLVTLDDTALTATLTSVFSFGTQQVRALAYHQTEKILYGASGTDLIKIDPTLAPVAIQEVVELTGLDFEIASMDFSHEDVLYVVDVEKNFFKIDLTAAHAEFMGVLDVSAGVSGLTFVVGAPSDVDPIKTICSSTLTSSASATSGTTDPKLSRFKLKKNPLHRAIGLFKFEGLEGETVTLNLELEGEESAEAVVEESSVNELENPWLNYWKGKGRVFLGIRDSIPGLDFRKRKKEQIPFSMSATLPADGTYYVMVIRPLLRFYKTDYCITLDSDYEEESQAWKTFDVAWPQDESDDDTASTSAAETEEVQKSTETVDSGSADDDPVPVALSTTAIAPTSTPPEEPVAETTGEDETAVDDDDTEVVQTDGGDTTVEKLVEVTVEEPAVEPPVETEPAADGDGDPEVAHSSSNETPVVETVVETPAVPEPVAEGGGDTEVVQTDTGVTTVEEPVVVTPEEPVVETPVEAVPAADEVGGTEPGDDIVDDGYSDDPMEDPLPMKE